MTYVIGEALDVLRTLDADRFQCCVTSPPYWNLRSYLDADDPQKAHELGGEATPEEYVANMVHVFREVRRVLRPDGVAWVNLGDTYDRGRLLGIPWRFALAAQADGWVLRSEVIWSKPDALPEAAKSRPNRDHEHVFMLTRAPSSYFDADAVREPLKHPDKAREIAESVAAGTAVANDRYSTMSGRNDGGGHYNGFLQDPDKGRLLRTVWEIPKGHLQGNHFASFPVALVERCILAGSRIGDEVLDPFLGSGTVGMVAESLGRRWLGVELNAAYEPLIKQRTAQVGLFGRTGL